MAMAAMAEAAEAAIDAERRADDDRIQQQQELLIKIEDGVSARAAHIRKEADSLTLSKFRRLLEQDLGLGEFQLDVHKKQIQELVDEILNSDEPSTAAFPDNAAIEGAVLKRLSYFKKEADKVSMQHIRRLLEEDLSLEKFTLDTNRHLVQELVDKVIAGSSAVECSKDHSAEASSDPQASREQSPVVQKDQSKKRKLQRKGASEKVPAQKSKSEEKLPAKKSKSEVKVPAAKSKSDQSEDESETVQPSDKTTEPSREDESDQSVSPVKATKKRKNTRIVESDESDRSRSSSPKPRQPKKKALKTPEPKATPLQSKLIDQLKQMIKSAGMNIPPSCYKRVKQLPEREREDGLVKELESILKREGLNRHSSEKDIKAVKKKKEKLKDLEGIDVGNILTKGRGRRQAATDFYAAKLEQSEDSNKSDVQEVVEDSD